MAQNYRWAMIIQIKRSLPIWDTRRRPCTGPPMSPFENAASWSDHPDGASSSFSSLNRPRTHMRLSALQATGCMRFGQPVAISSSAVMLPGVASQASSRMPLTSSSKGGYLDALPLRLTTSFSSRWW